jgi:type I restriction enzyme S subunit
MELTTKPAYKQTEVGLIPEDWECKAINDVCFLKHGFQFLDEHFRKTGIGVVKIGNLEDGKGIKEKNLTFVSIELANRLRNFYLSKGDVLMALTGGTLGKVSMVDTDKPLLQNYRVGNFLPNVELNKSFLHQILTSFYLKNAVKKLVNEAAQPNFGKQDFDKLFVPIPPTLTEQKAIATALSDVDALIASLEQTITKKKAIKQGAMQQLLTLPHKGGKRLPGFSGEWVEKELDKVLKFGSGQDYKHLSKGDIPVYGTGGIMTYVNSHLYNGDSVGIGRKGTIDKPVFLSGKFWTVDTLFYTENFSGTIPKFIYYKFLMITWKEYNEASGVPSLNKNTLGKIKIALPPTLNEQKAIAQILSDMDTEITQFESKKAKHQAIKQGMMQELLTGKTRLV